MKGIVLYHEKNRTYVLDRDGIFRRVKGLGNRSVAEEVDLPFFLSRRFQVSVSVAASFIVLLAVAFAVVFGVSSYYLCVDVSPSVEISFNVFNLYRSARALNPEGEVILDGLDLRGPPERVVSDIVRKMNEFEYISDAPENGVKICVTVVGRNERACAAVEHRLQPLLDDAERQYPILLSSCDFELREKAEYLGVSSGVLLLAELFQENNEEIPLADILEMPVRDILKGVPPHDSASRQRE